MEDSAQAGTHTLTEFREELGRCWRALPDKTLAGVLLVAWLALFHFFGNSTLGYTATHSLFRWMEYAYSMSADDEHGRLVPFAVLGLYWWKRQALMAVRKAPWWPGLGLLALALLVHAVGYMVQQTRISIIGFFLGVYAVTGIAWGWGWLKASFFPFCLFVFCVPVGTLTETITFPLRLVATNITAAVSRVGLGIDVIRDGTRIFDPNGAYQYEVAAACSGIRSLTVTLAIAITYAFVYFKSPWRRALIVAAAVPVAVAANVIRLTSIIIAAEVFGQAAGDYVHQSAWLSLLPYVPALLGIVLLGYWLRENRARSLASVDPTA